MAKGKNKLPKRLFKGVERVSSYVHDRSQTSRMKQVARDHEDLLQNVEAVIVMAWRDDPAVDDRAASMALRGAMAGAEPQEPVAASLYQELARVREFRSDASDPVWIEALRVVDESVKRHSDRSPGARGYLRFASQFIP